MQYEFEQTLGVSGEHASGVEDMQNFPGGQKSLACYGPWDHKESDIT